MKYIITGVDKQGNRIAATLSTKTTRKSKLLSRLDSDFKATYGYSLNELKQLYVGKLNKHTKLDEIHRAIIPDANNNV
jgi:hypothetical protein